MDSRVRGNDGICVRFGDNFAARRTKKGRDHSRPFSISTGG